MHALLTVKALPSKLEVAGILSSAAECPDRPGGEAQRLPA